MITNTMTERYASILAEHKIICKCGHRVFVSKLNDRKLCTWCGNYVYRTKQLEFRYKVIELKKKFEKLTKIKIEE